MSAKKSQLAHIARDFGANREAEKTGTFVA